MEKSLKFLVTITNVMAPQTSFSPDQVVWIIFKYGEVKNVRLVQAAFRREFYSINYRKMPDISSFRRVIQRFEISGGNAQPKKRQGKGIPDDDIKQVHDYFKSKDDAHLRDASRDLGFSVKKVWLILKTKLKWRSYTPTLSACLTASNISSRLTAADWFLNHDSTFFQDKIIWSDEKYFVLKQGPNKSIHRVWSPVNPYLNVECKTQSQQKIMVWVGLCAGQVIGPFWIEQTMDNGVYNKLLKEKVWPAVKAKATRNALWYMQDGATCHTSQNNLSFLLDKFDGRVISNKTDVIWPPNSPDLNPLDFFFWGYVQQEVYRVKPATINDLKIVVEDFIAGIDKEIIKKSCVSARKRFEMMRKEGGRRFEHKKNALKQSFNGEH